MEEINKESSLQPENISEKKPFWQNPKLPVVVTLAVVVLTVSGVGIGFYLKTAALIPPTPPFPTPRVTPSTSPIPLEGITLTTDKTEYIVEDTINIVIKNSSDEYIFSVSPSFRSDSTLKFQGLYNNEWEDIILRPKYRLPLAIGVLEPKEKEKIGIKISEIKERSETEDLSKFEKYRIKFVYDTGALRDYDILHPGNYAEIKRLLQNGKTIYSNEFRIGEKIQPKEEISEIRLDVDAPFSNATIIIDQQGIINYEAKGGIRTDIGTQKNSGKISKEQYGELVRLIIDNGFFSFKDSYVEEYLMDATTYTIAVKRDSQTKSVSCYGTCPEKVVEIRKKIEELWGKEILEVGV